MFPQPMEAAGHSHGPSLPIASHVFGKGHCSLCQPLFSIPREEQRAGFSLRFTKGWVSFGKGSSAQEREVMTAPGRGRFQRACAPGPSGSFIGLLLGLTPGPLPPAGSLLPSETSEHLFSLKSSSAAERLGERKNLR